MDPPIALKEAPTLLPEPSKEPEAFQQEEQLQTSEKAAPLPPELPHEVTAQSPEQHRVTISPLVSDQVQPLALDSVTMEPPEVTNGVRIESSTEQKAPAQPSVTPEQFGPFTNEEEGLTEQPNAAVKPAPPPLPSRVPTQPTELPREYSPRQQESSALPLNSTAGAALESDQHQLSTQPWRPSVAFKLTESITFSGQPSVPPEDTGPFPAPQEAEAPLSGSPKEVETSPAQQVMPPQPVDLPEGRPQPVLLPFPSPSPELPEEVELSPTQAVDPPQHSQEPPSESASPPPTHYEMTVPPLGRDQVLPPLPSVTFHPLVLEATITAEATVEEKSIALSPRRPELTVLYEISIPGTTGLLGPELTGTPPSTTETEASPAVQETVSQPPAPAREAASQAPAPRETSVPTPGQGPAQPPASAVITGQPLDQEPTTAAVPTTEATQSAAPQESTAPPATHPEVTLSPPHLAPAQHPNLTAITVGPSDLELSRTPQPTEVRPLPTVSETPSQPPRLSEETVPQAPGPPENAPTPAQEPAQHSASHSVTGQPSDMARTTTEATHSAALQESTVPPSVHSGVTLPPPGQTPAQYQSLVGVTTQPLEEKAFALQKEQSVVTHTDICELCSCREETLSCTGLDPEKRLKQVPALEPGAHNTTFTVFNFQGNSISYLDKNIWTTYQWAEKLNLSENSLTELRKDSFEGLLSLQYLDLSCNKIQSVERGTFESLPFLQFVNLRCNLLTELSFGTFQAWHGMQFLHQVILNHNPLTTIEDPSLFKLPALKYLDLGATHVPLAVLESVVAVTLALEELILPSHMACCLCQFKSDIEVVCRTVKLRCEGACVSNTTQCSVEAAAMGNVEGTFMKAFQARKKTTSAELTIEPERPSSQQSGGGWLALANQQLDFHDESDVISALSYILPYLSEGDPGAVESTLLPFIQLLFENVQDRKHSLPSLKKNIRKSFIPESNNLIYKNRLKKLYFLRNWLDAEIQKKIKEVKQEEETVLLRRPGPLGPRLQPHTLARAPAQGRRGRRRPRAADGALGGPKRRRKRLLGDPRTRQVRPRRAARALAAASGAPAPRSWSSGPGAPRPGHRAGNHAAGRQAAASLSGPWPGRPPSSGSANAPRAVRAGRGDLGPGVWVLMRAQDRVLRRKAAAPALRARESLLAAGTLSPGAGVAAQATPGAQLTKGSTLRGRSPVRRLPFSVLRSLIDVPPVPGELRASAADPAAGTDMGTDAPPQDFASSEMQLNQRLQLIIPDDDTRRLVSNVISTWKSDCMQPPLPRNCAQLLARTHRLLTLLREQQEAKVSQAQRELEQGGPDTSVGEHTGSQGQQRRPQEQWKFRQQVPGCTYTSLYIILALAALSVVLIAVIVALCLRKSDRCRGAWVRQQETLRELSEEAPPTRSASELGESNKESDMESDSLVEVPVS
ncbi:leucine-rich repeat-containing protein 37A2-like [Octodon degus]|uniref:Leucine-rich repeat-containing protein 37A2-like n=1 Tax=Octodon degus TaxID=10160 RepID=A0A6P6EPG0_OCTDE|nr:leucine-rich repeat-containing protein 37A2-like [Octodon degus]